MIASSVFFLPGLMLKRAIPVLSENARKKHSLFSHANGRFVLRGSAGQRSRVSSIERRSGDVQFFRLLTLREDLAP